MATIMLDDTISSEEVSKSREMFESIKVPTDSDKFQFALSLIRASNKNFIAEGLSLFQTLFTVTKDEDIKRDSLYYMAIAQTKLSNYEQALKYTQSILNVQPKNEQVTELEKEIVRRMKRDGLIGMGIAGSAAIVGFVGLVGLGAAMIFGKKN